jgi:prepilin-type processing-associated H-X9-DG protein
VRCSACGVALSGSPAANAGVEAKTSGLAIAALVLGILALFTCGITALPAIICGIIALMRISGSRGLLKGTGLAITGITLPVVSIALIVVVLILPALSRAKFEARRIICEANLQSLSVAMTRYANNYSGRLPTFDQWCDLLVREADVPKQSFHCPGAPQGTCSYAINANLRTASGPDAARLVALFECQPGWNQVGGSELLTTEYHEGKGCNVAFADGHVAFVRTEDLGGLIWMTDQ